MTYNSEVAYIRLANSLKTELQSLVDDNPEEYKRLSDEIDKFTAMVDNQWATRKAGEVVLENNYAKLMSLQTEVNKSIIQHSACFGEQKVGDIFLEECNKLLSRAKTEPLEDVNEDFNELFSYLKENIGFFSPTQYVKLEKELYKVRTYSLASKIYNNPDDVPEIISSIKRDEQPNILDTLRETFSKIMLSKDRKFENLQKDLKQYLICSDNKKEMLLNDGEYWNTLFKGMQLMENPETEIQIEEPKPKPKLNPPIKKEEALSQDYFNHLYSQYVPVKQSGSLFKKLAPLDDYIGKLQFIGNISDKDNDATIRKALGEDRLIPSDVALRYIALGLIFSYNDANGDIVRLNYKSLNDSTSNLLKPSYPFYGIRSFVTRSEPNDSFSFLSIDKSNYNDNEKFRGEHTRFTDNTSKNNSAILYKDNWDERDRLHTYIDDKQYKITNEVLEAMRFANNFTFNSPIINEMFSNYLINSNFEDFKEPLDTDTLLYQNPGAKKYYQLINEKVARHKDDDDYSKLTLTKMATKRGTYKAVKVAEKPYLSPFQNATYNLGLTKDSKNYPAKVLRDVQLATIQDSVFRAQVVHNNKIEATLLPSHLAGPTTTRFFTNLKLQLDYAKEAYIKNTPYIIEVCKKANNERNKQYHTSPEILEDLEKTWQNSYLNPYNSDNKNYNEYSHTQNLTNHNLDNNNKESTKTEKTDNTQLDKHYIKLSTQMTDEFIGNENEKEM